MAQPRFLSEAELTRVLRALGFTVNAAGSDGLVLYSHPELPVEHLVFDFSKGPIPQELVAATLTEVGLNLEF